MPRPTYAAVIGVAPAAPTGTVILAGPTRSLRSVMPNDGEPVAVKALGPLLAEIAGPPFWVLLQEECMPANEPKRPTAATTRAPRLAILGLLVAVLLIGAAAALMLTGHGSDGGVSDIGGPFALIDGDRKPVTDQDFRGKFMLVYFGYSFCPDVCPTTLNEIADAMDRLGPAAARVQPIFITVDPKRDTPAVIKQYAANFSPRLLGLTGTPEQIAKVAKEYRVYYAEHRTGPGPNDYSMDHSSILYLMGPDGRFIEPIPAEDSAATIAAVIEKAVS